ncbi:MAG: hypothetical protein JXJ19_10165 [Elusimicrobia bacterium]|nr:hypothetical protein [Elusimicrobiota bacterium]
MKKQIVILLSAVICSVVQLSFGDYQYRMSMKTSTTQIEKQLLLNIESGDYESISKIVMYLSPLLDAIKTRYGVDLKTELNAAAQKHDKDTMKSAVLKFVIYDILDLFYLSNDSSSQIQPEIRKMWITLAAANYVLISENVKTRSETSDEAVRNALKKALVYGFVFEEGSGKITGVKTDVLSECMTLVKSEFFKVYPDFSR